MCMLPVPIILIQLDNMMCILKLSWYLLYERYLFIVNELQKIVNMFLFQSEKNILTLFQRVRWLLIEEMRCEKIDCTCECKSNRHTRTLLLLRRWTSTRRHAYRRSRRCRRRPRGIRSNSRRSASRASWRRFCPLLASSAPPLPPSPRSDRLPHCLHS